MRVVDPHGGRWHVRRRWWLWRPRAMELMRGTADFEQGGDDAERAATYGGVLVPRGNAVFSVTGLPLAALERLLLLLLLPPTLAARALRAVPWTVVVRRERETPWETSVRGGAAAQQLVADIVGDIEQGRRPAPEG